MRKILLLFMCFAIALSFAACADKQADTEVPDDEVLLASVYDMDMSSSIVQMVGKSELVVRGKYVRYDSSWNMRRNPANPLEEAEDEYVEGRLYVFSVDEIYKGSCEEEILVNHRYAEKTISLLDRESTFMLCDPLFCEPQLGEEYVLCLNKDDDFGNYYGATNPFSVLVSSEGSVSLCVNQPDEDGAYYQMVDINGKQYKYMIKGVYLTDYVSGMSSEDFFAKIEGLCK